MSESPVTFAELGLSPEILRAVEKAGYQHPTPIQARTIVPMLSGGDVLGQAQTGTGKTAAFTLPLLSRLKRGGRGPHVLVLAPTRELAIQVAASMQTYGQFLPRFRVLPVYGGAAFGPQLQGLRGGCDVVVGTPGRVMDHMRRGSLDLSTLQALVLDEADEMLKMGFIDDVEWILEQTPAERQIALFSATMPPEIRRIAGRYLRDATHVAIEQATATADTIRQRHVVCHRDQRVATLVRILRVEPVDGVLVFVRTRNATMEVAEALTAQGIQATALSGEVAQGQREKIVQQLRAGRINVIVATDVAARGLDVSRISHVINFDLPDDTETYVHRIGRTGRAGRTGEAICIIGPRETHRLRRLENATRQRMDRFEFPTAEELQRRRLRDLTQAIGTALEATDFDDLEALVADYAAQHNVPLQRVAAALARCLPAGAPVVVPPEPPRPAERATRPNRPRRDGERAPRREGERPPRRGGERSRPAPDRQPKGPTTAMDKYRLEVGSSHGVEPRHIVGAIAGESGLRGRDIGRVEIHAEHSLVDLPPGMPKEILRTLKRTWIAQRQLHLTKVSP